MLMKKFALALDLKNNPILIQEYIDYHRKIWPEIAESILKAGILNMEIYHIGDRLFMIMETVDDFNFETKSKMDAANPKVQEWEALMWKYQKALPWAKEGEKWMLMEKIFQIK
jgi:L-rhamnose mutarotase